MRFLASEQQNLNPMDFVGQFANREVSAGECKIDEPRLTAMECFVADAICLGVAMRKLLKSKAVKPIPVKEAMVETLRDGMTSTIVSDGIQSDNTENAMKSALTGVTNEERHQLIAKAAYYRSERRNFAPGCELEDWLGAEAEIEMFLSKGDMDSPRRSI